MGDFVAVPVMPVFKGMSKEFAERLEKPARESGKRAGKAISDGLGDAVTSLERQVKASESKLEKFSRDSEKAYSKQEQKKQDLKSVTLELQAAEEKYNKAVADGKSGTAELARVEKAKGRVLKATTDLKDAESDARAAAKKYEDQQKDLADTSAKLEKAQDDAASNTRRFGDAMDDAEKKSGLFEGGLVKVAAAATAMVGAAAGIGKIAYDIGAAFDDANDSIRVGTGATGDALAGLEESMKNVAKNSIGIGSDMGAIGEAIADVNTRLGLTGKPLEQFSSQLLQLEGMGVDADINSVSQALQGFGVEAEQAPAALDSLFQISQATGLSVTELADSAVKAGPALRGFGFSMEDSAALVGSLDKAGLDADKTLASMQRALANFAKEGKDAPAALQETIGSIEDMIAAGDEAGAMNLAGELFGTRGAAQFVDAVKSGTLSVEDMMAATGATGDTIDQVAQETADFAEKWDNFKNRALLAIEPVASAVFDWLGGAIEGAADKFEGFVSWVTGTLIPTLQQIPDMLRTVGQWIDDNSGKLLAIAVTVAPIVIPILVGLIAQWVAAGTAATISAGKQVAAWVVTKAEAVKSGALTILNLWKVGAGWIAAGAQATLGAAKMAAAWVVGMGPVGWVIAGLTAVGAALWAFFSKTETGRELWSSFTSWLGESWQWIQDTFAAGWAWLQENVFSPIATFFTETLPGAIGPIIDWIGAKWNEMGLAFQAVWAWLYESVLQPIVSFFTETLWPTFQSVMGWIGDAFRQMGDTLAAIWGWIVDTVMAAWHREVTGMKAIWDFVTGAIIGGWNWLRDSLAAVWDWIVGVIVAGWHREVTGLKNIFEFVTGAIVGSWNWMRDMLHAAWTWIDENVFAPLGRALGIVEGWFRSAVDNIGRIWDGIKDKTKRPVQFVVDVVYNNGIRKAWNAVAGLVGLDKLQEIKFATGGILPGYTPGRDPYTFIEPNTGMRIGLSGGEGILRPEATRALGKDWLDNVNAAARKGGVSAVRERLKHSHFANGGIIDLGNFAKGGFTNLAGALSAIQQSHAEFVGRFFPNLFALTSASRSEPGSMHDFSRGAATDWQAQDGQYATQMPTPASKALARAIEKNFPNTTQLIHYPLDGWNNLLNGNPFDYGVATNSQHGNHVHWGTNSPLRFDGDNIVLDDVPGVSGGGWNPLNMVKRLWDGVVSKIGDFPGADKFGEWGKLPGAMAKKLIDAAWNFVSGKAAKEESAFQGDPGAGVEQWRPMVEAVLKDKGFPLSLANSVLRRMNQESGGNARAINDWDINAQRGTPSKGLMQVIDPTFQAHKDPGYDNIWDPEANLRASMNYAVATYGSLPAAYDRAGGYSLGGIVDLAKLYDTGGWLPDRGVAVNQSGKPEPVFNHQQWGMISRMILQMGELVPAIKGQTTVLAKQVAAQEKWLAKAANPETVEGATVRSLAAEFGEIAGMLGGEEINTVVSHLLKSEQALLDARAEHASRIQAVSDKQKALKDAQDALKAAMDESGDAAKEAADAASESAEQIKEAEKQLEDARTSGDAGKISEAEKNLSKVRDESSKKSGDAEKKRAETVKKANEDVAKAEADLAAARLESARALDMPIHDLMPALDDMARAGQKAASQAGLGGVAAALGQLATLSGPAGISVGVAIETIKQIISFVTMIIDLIKKLIERIYQAQLESRKAVEETFSIIADYAKLLVEMQTHVSKLQQELVRGMNAQRTAEFELRVAQQDRMVAEVEGALAVAEARLDLDEEIRKGAVAAQLRLMGLHEDWDSYLAYQALAAQGVAAQWSDTAISALFAYEAARAKALQGELKARVDQIKAEAVLAEATRQNARNQADLLTAQERLIRMSAKVAGVDLVEATGGAQAAKLLVEMFENQNALDKNVLGRWGYQMGANGSFANEYRGQLAQQETLKKALDAVLAESGVSLGDVDLKNLFSLMGQVAWRGGDPMEIIRAKLPQLVEAETALKINDSLKPIYDAKDDLTNAGREVEDLKAEIDLFEKVTPLDETIKGLDYTIKGLEQSSQAWADGNEKLRQDYLKAAKANADAAAGLGVNWQLDDKYAAGDVRERIRSEYTIYMDGSEMYTADQIDVLLARVTAGSNVKVTTVLSASDVAARRKERV